MLPSQGLFRSIPCPSFLAGLCERPHCAYRHCKSDISIDRKLDIEALDAETLEEDLGVAFSSKSVEDTKDSKQTPSTDAATVQSANNKTYSSELASKEKETKKEKSPERHKRRLSLEPVDGEQKPTKRRRDSEEKPTVMGGILTACETVIQACLPKSEKKPEPDKLPDIDALVREIEGTGKSSDSHRSRHHKHKKSSRSHSHKHRSSSKDSSEKDKHRDSHRKENGSKNEHHHHSRKDDKKKDEKKDSKKSSSRHHESHRRKESTSKSSSSSRSQKSSVSSGVSSPSKDRRDSSSSSSSSPRKNSSQESTDSAKEQKSTSTSIYASDNRFNALAEGSLADEESAYNSLDIFEDDFSYVGGSDSEEDPEIVARECLAMFESYKPDQDVKPQEDLNLAKDTTAKKEDNADDGFCLVGKKRVAHGNILPKSGLAPAPPSPPKKPPATSKNLQETLIKRLEDQAKLRQSSSTPTPSTKFAVPAKPAATGKARIAHVPNAGKLANKPTINSSGATNKSSPSSNSKPGQPGSLTYSQTAAKGVARQAHTPSEKITQKTGPIVFKDAINKSSKIPHSTRQAILDKLYVEYVRLFEECDKAFEATVKREDELISRCSSKQVYYSSGISVISGLRKTNKQDNDLSSNPYPVVSHEQILLGSLESRNCSVRAGKKSGVLPEGSDLYKALLRYKMTEEQLADNGYPRPHPSKEKGRVTAKPRQGEVSMSWTDRICDRCKRRYKVGEDGDHVIKEVCDYHWGRKYNMMASRMGRGMREATYSCCGDGDDKNGCASAKCHVSKSPFPLSSQKGFVTCVRDEADIEQMGNDKWDIIGIDCEMVYTTHGNELARVTVVGIDGRKLYDVVVRPSHKVLDCNTRFSGLEQTDIDKATNMITDVQAVLLTHLRPNTLLIGHSLESDLIALKLCHDSVIDTTILYPHRMGAPKKRALKTLSVEVLRKVIQESVGGHDSAEDAQVAVELVLAKLKSDLASK